MYEMNENQMFSSNMIHIFYFPLILFLWPIMKIEKNKTLSAKAYFYVTRNKKKIEENQQTKNTKCLESIDEISNVIPL